MKAPRALALSAALASLAGAACSANETAGPAGGERTGATSEALLGAFGSADCTPDVTAFLPSAVNLGKAIAVTPELAACVAARYVPCGAETGLLSFVGDPRRDAPSLVATARSANATKTACRTDLALPALASTQSDDEHGYGYTDVEEIKLSLAPYQGFAAQWNAGTGTAGYSAASLIWHEAMHVHGYSHGANQNPQADALCGYAGRRAPDGTPAGWQATSGPYVVQACVASVGGSFVANAIQAGHKRVIPAFVNTLDRKLASGAFTAEQVRALARRNGVREQATPLPFNGNLVDELFDTADRDWYAVTVPGKMPVRIIVESMDGTAPSQVRVIPSAGSPFSYAPLPPEIATRVDMTRTLEGGVWYVQVFGAALTQPFRISVGEAPPAAPASCTGTLVCGSRVDFTCAAGPRVRFVEHSADGAAWTGADGLSAPTYRAADGSIAAGRYYRVCEKAVTSSGKACTPAIDVYDLPATCDGSPPGGGPTDGAGGKRCHGHLCGTHAPDGMP